ncbi:diacylglycerol kinase, epsilon, putative [Perkinsus marinus ATCC 50983]|uniref:Diacylglycerol kinase n=1 Tax=Perkinsus marinus (strain ATCC 50983 / TXsc) TaxID=423536 RepID=C5KDZ6_PERM5|nr:diacylglycerol kinase, epsilon, putative [Perkinsus marinus ATCC 50983]EER17449.1 diacylglycerol kinase, epsilon, putative [Perkinsus marinus ATCC 50983]|eukprot:XP_002785653.1 diacylglycerol kinase, epsilon, putative [Perkinsus marinus ATCC 50983]
MSLLCCWALLVGHYTVLTTASEPLLSHVEESPLEEGGTPLISSDPLQVCKQLSSDILILVNPKSGGNKAAGLLTVDTPYHYHESTVNMIDIIALANGDAEAYAGIEALKKSIDNGPPERCEKVVIAGGDGTVTWGVDLMTKAGINLEKVAIGIIPYGTGNDFSQSLGWGKTIDSTLPGKGNRALNQWIHHWAGASVHYFDLWQVTVDVHPGGWFTEGAQEQVIQTSEDLKQNALSITKSMSNYFSIGVDATILKEFQKKRTRSRAGNHLMYALAGLKTSVRRRVGTESFLDSVKDDGHLLFNVARRRGSTRRENKTLTKNAATIICLNTYTYAGGRRIWEGTYGKGSAIIGYQDETLKDKQQDFGDKKLELMMYTDVASFSLDAGARAKSTGNRLHQTGGPLTFEFRSDLDARTPVDFQIDGEYTTAFSPKAATVSHYKRLNVLVNQPRPGVEEVLEKKEKKKRLNPLLKRRGAQRRPKAPTSSEESIDSDNKLCKGFFGFKLCRR